MVSARPAQAGVALVTLLVVLAWLRPIDHDESQYVAAAALTARGLIPYRDYAYLQTPLQPFVLAPVVWAFGAWAYPALRIVNALLGAVVVVASFAGMRVLGVRRGVALTCAALLVCCDIMLFSAGTARNDALPAALFALALPLVLRRERDGGERGSALLIGLLLASAAAAKISYAVPAALYGVYALCVPRHRPGWVAIGTVPAVALLAATFAAQPSGFWYGVVRFPTMAPADYYLATGRAWKLGQGAKAFDMLKFLALGPALLALASVVRTRERRWPSVLEWLILAGLLAALLPTPTWRQYLLPVLPPLFVRLAELWNAHPPRRGVRIAAVVFAVAGLAPSMEALLKAAGGVPMTAAMRDGGAIRDALDRRGVGGAIATLSPQFVPATRRAIDPRFAAGPFHFRSRTLLGPDDEAALGLVSRASLDSALTHAQPGAILVGGEGRWTSGDDALDAVLADCAEARGWRRVAVRGTRFTLYLPGGRARVGRSAISAP